MKKLIALVLCFYTLPSFAASEIEKEKLQQIVNELEVVKQLVREAEGYSSSSDPQVFEYRSLLWNLEEMKGAVSRHINSPSTKPRSFDELMVIGGAQ